MENYLSERKKYSMKKYPDSIIKLPFIGYFNHNRYSNPLFNDYRKNTFVHSDYVKSNPFAGYMDHSSNKNRHYLNSEDYMNNILIPHILGNYYKKYKANDLYIDMNYIDMDDLDNLEFKEFPDSTPSSICKSKSYGNLTSSYESYYSNTPSNKSTDYELIESDNTIDVIESNSWLSYLNIGSYFKKIEK